MIRIPTASLLGAALLATAGCATTATTSENGLPMVGGAEMSPERTIVENASMSADHETLVAALDAAGLVETLEGEGPFTVLAPTDDAFDDLPDGTVENLMNPAAKSTLATILSCHVIPAKAMSADVVAMVEGDGGEHEVETVGGCTIVAKADGDTVTFTDENGTVATVTRADVEQSNGVIHVVDTVLLPQR